MVPASHQRPNNKPLATDVPQKHHMAQQPFMQYVTDMDWFSLSIQWRRGVMKKTYNSYDKVLTRAG
jgi:hypothetical protein